MLPFSELQAWATEVAPTFTKSALRGKPQDKACADWQKISGFLGKVMFVGAPGRRNCAPTREGVFFLVWYD